MCAEIFCMDTRIGAAASVTVTVSPNTTYRIFQNSCTQGAFLNLPAVVIRAVER